MRDLQLYLRRLQLPINIVIKLTSISMIFTEYLYQKNSQAQWSLCPDHQ